LIIHHSVFKNKSRNKQGFVWVQLAVTLARLGAHGNGSSVGMLARRFGLGVGTVELYFSRVEKAILSLRRRFIRYVLSLIRSWPNAAEREIISGRHDTRYALKGVVSIFDGSHIPYNCKPGVDGEVFWTRKSEYAVCVLAACDDTRRITYVMSGWPGSCFDGSIFKDSGVYINPELWYSSGEYSLGDSAFPRGPRMLIPYVQPAASIAENTAFNVMFSSLMFSTLCR
jgi:hypothetical protein